MKIENDNYAIPSLKKLPIHDREHILMAANAINSVKGITDEQRMEGRIAIAVAADRFGIKAKAASKITLSMEAMAIEMPDVPDHPNRHPFSGIMTRLDIASDFPVGGTTRKKVIIPMAVAEAGLPTLLGMAIDFVDDFSGHDRRSKIGIITEATIGEEDLVLGTPLHIAGFFYAADFPDEVAHIQAHKELLGFSYEAVAFVESMKSDPWVCSACSFTGAAVLYKDKAAFTATSIQASKGESTMKLTAEEIAAMQKQNAELIASKAEADKKIADLEAEAAIAVAAASVHALVKPHADALRACATNMVAAGIGADASRGHAAVLNKMADQMEASSILGKVPDSFDSYFYGSADKEATGDAAALVAAAVKPFEDMLASMQTKLDDAVKSIPATVTAAAAADDVIAGTRKSLSAAATLAKIGLTVSADAKLSIAAIDEAANKAGLKSQDSMALKMNLRAAGLIE